MPAVYVHAFILLTEITYARAHVTTSSSVELDHSLKEGVRVKWCLGRLIFVRNIVSKSAVREENRKFEI